MSLFLALLQSNNLFSIIRDLIPNSKEQLSSTFSYTKEYLSELRANTPSTPVSFQNQENIIAEKFPSTIGPGIII